MVKYTDKQKLEAVKAYKKGTGGLLASIIGGRRSIGQCGGGGARRQALA